MGGARRTAWAASCACRRRLKISWQDDNTLKIETDAGQQTRLLQFRRAGRGRSDSGGAPARTLQGYSVAEWQRSGGAFDAFLGRGAGAGAPALGIAQGHDDEHARPAGCVATACPTARTPPITEYFTRVTNPEAGDWFVVTTVVEDPTVPGAAVHHQLELQEGAERLQVESDAV